MGWNNISINKLENSTYNLDKFNNKDFYFVYIHFILNVKIKKKIS